MDLIWAKFVTNYTNMVEDKEDKSSMCGKLIPNKERFSWDALKLALEIHEPTRSNRSLKFSWDNQKSGGKIIMLKLIEFTFPSTYPPTKLTIAPTIS
jgi:hypothetical protein